MAVKVQFRRGTAAQWTSADPLLAEGEMGFELDTNLFKVGNGVDNWEDLPYGGLVGATGPTGANIYTADTAPTTAPTGALWFESDTTKLFTYYSGAWVEVSGGGGGGAGLTWLTKTSAYTAMANDAIIANTSGGSFTVTLPSSPTIGDTVTFVDPTGDWGTSHLVVTSPDNIMGSSQDLNLNVNYAKIALTYIDATSGWRVL